MSKPKRSAAMAMRLLRLMRPAGRLKIDDELVATDRIMRRWAVSIGDGLPSDVWDDQPQSRPPPLDDDTAVIVDRAVNGLPDRERKLAVLWWKVPEGRMSAHDVSRRMGWMHPGGYPLDPYPHVNGLLQKLNLLLRRQGVDC